MKEKHCSRCEIVKIVSEYYNNKARGDKLSTYCKKCENELRIRRNRTKDGLAKRIWFGQIGNSIQKGNPSPSYSKKWLVSWILANPEFHRLYDMWVISGYEKDLIPSVDRVDDNIGYTEYNIQIMTWKQNRDKGNRDIIEGKNNKQSKSVVQFTKSGEFVCEYFSQRNASKVMGVKSESISSACLGKTKTVKGFIWRFKNEL